jgi:hypothetical protein
VSYRYCNRCGVILGTGMRAMFTTHMSHCPYASTALQRQLEKNAERINANMPWRHP